MFPFFSVHFSHNGADLPNCERVKNWHNRLHTWHQRDSGRWNTTGFLSNDLFFNTILLLLKHFEHDVPPKNVSETSCFPRKLTICWGNIVSGGPLPLSSWGHSWDIWVNWIATKWPQFIHCFSFFRSCTTVTLFVGLVHHHGNSQKILRKGTSTQHLNQKD